MPTVSVIIPTYQRGFCVGEAVASVLTQTYTDYEIVVVDDGSTDNTPEALSAFVGRITVARHGENKGVSAARNAGIRSSSGEYVAFLDADDLWMPDKLEKQLPLFDRSPSLGLVCSDAFNELGGVVLPGTHFQFRPPKAGMVYPELLRCNFIATPSVVTRRACFRVLGLFDEALRGAEDVDMWMRVSRSWMIDFVHEPLVKVRHFGDGLRTNTEVMIRSAFQLLEKVRREDPQIAPAILDQRFCYLSLELARFYRDQGERRKARAVLRRCLVNAGPTAALVRAWTATWVPNRVLGFVRGAGAGKRIAGRREARYEGH